MFFSSAKLRCAVCGGFVKNLSSLVKTLNVSKNYLCVVKSAVQLAFSFLNGGFLEVSVVFEFLYCF